MDSDKAISYDWFNMINKVLWRWPTKDDQPDFECDPLRLSIKLGSKPWIFVGVRCGFTCQGLPKFLHSEASWNNKLGNPFPEFDLQFSVCLYLSNKEGEILNLLAKSTRFARDQTGLVVHDFFFQGNDY